MNDGTWMHTLKVFVPSMTMKRNNLFYFFMDISIKECYDILRVHPSSSWDDIKKAHHKLIKLYHPDKGGDQQSFLKVNQAFEKLKTTFNEDENPSSKTEGFTEGLNMNSIFTMFTSVLSNMSKPANLANSKNPTITKDVYLTLEEAFVGIHKTISVNINKRCKQCHATCSRSGTPYMCSTCNGSGCSLYLPFIKDNNNNIVICPLCHGTGYKPPQDDVCMACSGKGSVIDETELNITCDPNTSIGTELFVPCGGGYPLSPGMMPADLVIRFMYDKHVTYTFNQSLSTMYFTCSISLEESICGFVKEIYHPSGHNIVLKCLPGKVVLHGSTYICTGKGLPLISAHGRSFSFGDLIITFNVKPPDDPLDEDMLKKLSEAFNYDNSLINQAAHTHLLR